MICGIVQSCGDKKTKQKTVIMRMRQTTRLLNLMDSRNWQNRGYVRDAFLLNDDVLGLVESCVSSVDPVPLLA